MKIRKTFNKFNIVYVIAFNQSHKSIKIIKKINRILRSTINKIKKFKKNFIDLLKKTKSIYNNCYVKYLEYTSLKILHNINYISIAIRSIKTLTILKKVVLFSIKNLLSLM